MDGLIDFPETSILHDLLPSCWFEDSLKGFALSDSEIAQSVHDASAFFHLDDPAVIQEYRTTGVVTGSPFTENDDVLVFNRQQMQKLGISDREGFDLVMTHECTHRMLQAVSEDLSPHREELCCDYMSGVRAGLNHMDVSQISEAMAAQVESATHPDGSQRVDAIAQGQHFAEKYWSEHHCAPTFDECYAEFRDLFPEEQTHNSGHGAGDIKEYTQAEIDRHVAKAERDMHEAKSRMEYYANWIRKHGTGTLLCDAEGGLRDAKRDYEHAKAELSKWKYTHADPKGFAETEMFSSEADSVHEYSSDVASADAEVRRCQKDVNSLFDKLEYAKSKYGTSSDEYKRVKNAYDKAQSALSDAREDHRRAVQNAHRNGTL